MTTAKYRTDLRCSACVSSLAPLLDEEPGVESWSADVDNPAKVLSVTGDVSRHRVAELLQRAGGYHLLGDVNDFATSTVEEKASYFPLVLIVAYILASTLVAEFAAGSFEWMRAMRHFMAGFFLVFSCFKLLDLRGFAASYSNYDLVAKAWPAYGYVYPFLELALGLAYLSGVWPRATDAATLVLMSIGGIGVLRTLLSGRKVRCACLGSVIQLPVATVTLIEDAGMALMALVMLLVSSAG